MVFRRSFYGRFRGGTRRSQPSAVWTMAAVALGASILTGSVLAGTIIMDSNASFAGSEPAEPSELSSISSQEAGVHAKRLTPVIFVEEVRPCIAFWTDVVGFEVTGEVPEGDGDDLGFVSVASGTLELMYQSYSGVAGDLPAMADRATGTWGILYVEVDDLDALKPKLEGLEVFSPERTTFYGAREIGVRAPCGTPVVFAVFEQDDEG